MPAPLDDAWGDGAGRSSRLSSRAFTATIRLDPDIVSAAISGLSTRPNAGSNTPAAMGSAIAWYPEHDRSGIYTLTPAAPLVNTNR